MSPEDVGGTFSVRSPTPCRSGVHLPDNARISLRHFKIIFGVCFRDLGNDDDELRTRTESRTCVCTGWYPLRCCAPVAAECLPSEFIKKY